MQATSDIDSQPKSTDQSGSSVCMAVVAVAADGVIGRDGDMPWRLSRDLRRFKRLTMGTTMIMGRKTFDSIGKALPGRQTVVVTRNPDWKPPPVDNPASENPPSDHTDEEIFPLEVAASPEAALSLAIEKYGDSAVSVVGGATIYKALLPRCNRLALTRVWSSTLGDTRIELPMGDFRLISRTRLPAGPRDSVPTDFEIWVRKKIAVSS